MDDKTEQAPIPCRYCGGDMVPIALSIKRAAVQCQRSGCEARGPVKDTLAAAALAAVRYAPLPVATVPKTQRMPRPDTRGAPYGGQPSVSAYIQHHMAKLYIGESFLVPDDLFSRGDPNVTFTPKAFGEKLSMLVSLIKNREVFSGKVFATSMCPTDPNRRVIIRRR